MWIDYASLLYIYIYRQCSTPFIGLLYIYNQSRTQIYTRLLVSYIYIYIYILGSMLCATTAVPIGLLCLLLLQLILCWYDDALNSAVNGAKSVWPWLPWGAPRTEILRQHLLWPIVGACFVRSGSLGSHSFACRAATATSVQDLCDKPLVYWTSPIRF